VFSFVPRYRRPGTWHRAHQAWPFAATVVSLAEIPLPGRIAEFCHAWIKSKLGLRQFRANGNAMALPHIQPTGLDPPKQVPGNTSSHLKE